MVRPVRRIIAGNDDNGKAVVLQDSASPDVKLDPARPGFASTRLWVSGSTPAKVAGIRETLDSPHELEPPPNGSICRFYEFPPERDYITNISERDVAAWFDSVAAPHAQINGPHPYMQKTRTLDLCYILEGEITLVTDDGEADLKPGNVAIIKGARHAWSNRSNAPCVIVLSQHAGVDEIAPEPPGAPAGAKAVDVPPQISALMRRVVVGANADGLSRMEYDGPVPNIFPRPSGSWFFEVWTIDEAPPHLLGDADGGAKGRSVMHSPPPEGANWRISYAATSKTPAPKVALEGKTATAMDTGGGTQRREGGHIAGMHRTPSLDYAICLEGDRVLILEDSEVVLNKGDVVIQCGNWHSWGAKSDVPTIMSYVMIGGEFG